MTLPSTVVSALLAEAAAPSDAAAPCKTLKTPLAIVRWLAGSTTSTGALGALEAPGGTGGLLGGIVGAGGVVCAGGGGMTTGVPPVAAGPVLGSVRGVAGILLAGLLTATGLAMRPLTAGGLDVALLAGDPTALGLGCARAPTDTEPVLVGVDVLVDVGFLP
jgi:hypothetical protein